MAVERGSGTAGNSKKKKQTRMQQLRDSVMRTQETLNAKKGIQSAGQNQGKYNVPQAPRQRKKNIVDSGKGVKTYGPAEKPVKSLGFQKEAATDVRKYVTPIDTSKSRRNKTNPPLAYGDINKARQTKLNKDIDASKQKADAERQAKIDAINKAGMNRTRQEKINAINNAGRARTEREQQKAADELHKRVAQQQRDYDAMKKKQAAQKKKKKTDSKPSSKVQITNAVYQPQTKKSSKSKSKKKKKG